MAQNRIRLKDANGNVLATIDQDDAADELNITNEETTTELKVENGRILVDGSPVSGLSTSVINDTDSPYTTSGEDVIYCDTSNGAVTVTLKTSDLSLGADIRVVNITGTNSVTVNTEGSATIDPGGASSVSITKAGWGVRFTGDGSNWDSSLVGEFVETITDVLTANEQAAKIYATADQTISNTTVTTVAFDAEDSSFSPGNVMTADLPNNKITIEKNGTYAVKGALRYLSPGDGTRLTGILKVDGSPVAEDNSVPGGDQLVGFIVPSEVEITTAPADITYDTRHNKGQSADLSGAYQSVFLTVARLG